ncbi:MAG: exosortase C-terminal domain/associated protein EpsI, partial [Sphingobium sp.]
VESLGKDEAIRNPIMLLIAYGASQSDLLQLHRPETCYPAVGMAITARRFAQIALGARAHLPVVELTAESGGRIEDIVYWTRLGEYLPLTAGEQREDRLKAAMAGYIGDGILVRASILRADDTQPPEWDTVANFLAEMVGRISAPHHKALIGTSLANQMSVGSRSG